MAIIRIMALSYSSVLPSYQSVLANSFAPAVALYNRVRLVRFQLAQHKD
jgi:hypothetical protein